jgi:hypothetical protein
MLVYQAKRACEIFTDRVIPDERADETAAVIARQMKNIALIGMPGCGKTSAGRELAKLTGREFADMDAEIVKRIGCSIPEFLQGPWRGGLQKAGDRGAGGVFKAQRHDNRHRRRRGDAQ